MEALGEALVSLEGGRFLHSVEALHGVSKAAEAGLQPTQ